MTDDQIIEARARAICVSKGVNPETLYQIHIWDGTEHFDFEDSGGRRFIYAWRKQVVHAEATLAADKAAGYWLAPMEATEDDLDAMVQASDASDRIQGFHYGNQFVIRDVLLADGEQVLWRGLDTDRPAFNQQLERERMRLLFAALRARQTQEGT